MRTEVEVRTKLRTLEGMLQVYVEKLRETGYDTSSEYVLEITQDLIGKSDNAFTKMVILRWVLEEE